MESADEISVRNEFLGKLIESASIGIAVVKPPDWKFVEANAVFRTVSGRPKSPFLGRPMAEVFPETLAGVVTGVLEEVAQTGRPRYLPGSETSVGPGEPEIYSDSDFLPLANSKGTVTGVLILARNVTEDVLTRRRSETLSLESARHLEQLETVIENVDQGIIVADPSGRVERMNRQALDIHGFKSTEEGLRMLPDGIRRHLRGARDERAPALPRGMAAGSGARR